jgi:hypothetical protein
VRVSSKKQLRARLLRKARSLFSRKGLPVDSLVYVERMMEGRGQVSYPIRG